MTNLEVIRSIHRQIRGYIQQYGHEPEIVYIGRDLVRKLTGDDYHNEVVYYPNMLKILGLTVRFAEEEKHEPEVY